MKASRFKMITRLILCLLILSLLAFIFSMSFADAETSAADSSWVLSLLNNTLKVLGTDFRFSHSFIRTLAHFLEFGALGFLSYFFAITFDTDFKKRIVFPLLFTASVAFVDEAIQLFSKGRAFQFTDILIDISGAFIFILFALLLTVITKVLSRNKDHKEIHND